MCVVPRTSLAMVSLGDLCGAGSKVVRESRVLAGARVRSTTRSWDAPLRVIDSEVVDRQLLSHAGS